jgi:myosin protein heavy chain
MFVKLIQQRTVQVELEDYRSQVSELGRSKKQLQTEIADLKDRLEVELIAKNDESST